MKTLLKPVRKINRKSRVYAKKKDVFENRFEGIDHPIDSQHLLISMLLPPAVKMFLQDCEREVDQLCGSRYQHGKELHRWGHQNGSVIMGNQHVAIERPRVRNLKTGEEVTLQTYQDFQDPRPFEQTVFAEGIKKVSQRDYQKGLSKIASSFGFTKSSVSRKWIKATAKNIELLRTRSLREMDIRAVFIDGKRFRDYGVIIALGVASSGQKFVLGIYQASSEDNKSCLELLNDLEKRGLPSEGLLFIVDGGSGLNKALDIKYFCDDVEKRKAIRLRCHVHKWRNLESALGDQAEKVRGLFWALREAKDLAEARQVSDKLEKLLGELNLSALHSYQEAKQDLLAIHELKLSPSLRRFFSSTNPIESLNSLIEEDMRRVKNWKNSEHFQRWLATYCLNSEKKMRRIRGYLELPALWIRLRYVLGEKNIDSGENVA